MSNLLFDNKNLLDPNYGHNSLDLSCYCSNDYIDLLQNMLLIRLCERKLASERANGVIGGPVHLGVGQEAIAVGVSSHLTKDDYVFGAHRSHSHLIALGSDIRKLFSEILGRNTGHSKGMGGSMHLWDKGSGFLGSVPIVAGTVSLAVGSAMASRMKNTGSVSVAYFGDGACEEGVVHESLNLASLQKDPVLFVVENNLFASHMHWTLRQPSAFTSRFAEANNIPYKIVDGNNILEVADATKELIDSARNGGGPGFLEAFTYRWYGHVDWREDIDVGVSRSREDVESWKAKDPIKRLLAGMITEDVFTESDYESLNDSLSKIVNDAWNLALNDPYPDESKTISRVYKS